ncbi:MAG TPA: DUF4252 domain-containing protein [Thermoanaerobaculia bacterium]|jgi:hypothetical protein|nr:DUF4252 domain-containing protein [Thermoanaerobaculia bacterium]
MHVKTAAPLFLLVAAAALAACAGPPSAEEVRGEIERQLPGARFLPEDHLRLGRFSLGLVRWLAGFDHDKEDEKDRALFRAISGVEIATYKVRSLPSLEGFRLPEKLERRLREEGWTLMVRSEEKDDHTWVLYRGARGTGANTPEVIRDLYVVCLDPKELSLIRVSGHLDKLMAAALADEPKKMARLTKAGA